jgi:hypothetical protein
MNHGVATGGRERQAIRVAEVAYYALDVPK